MSNETSGTNWIAVVLTAAAVAVGGGVAGYVALNHSQAPSLPIQACNGHPAPPLCDVPSGVNPSAPPLRGAPSTATSFSPDIVCPTGECDPISNGQGVYFANETHDAARQCLPGFCPEAFVNADGRVVIVGRNTDKNNGASLGKIETRDVFVSPPDGPEGRAVRIAADEHGGLAITYDNGAIHTEKGDGLAKLTLKLSSSEVPGAAPASLYMGLSSAAGSPGTPGGNQYQEYHVNYGQAPAGVNQLCAGDSVTFFSGKRIETWSARVTSADVTTIACESGAIAKCMGLGYTPQGAGGKATSQQADYLFASCLQAMRAAYFVGQNDYKSYTHDGTKIFVRDLYGIQDAQIARLEALWSPEGAVCLNMDNLRVPGSVTDSRGVPPCGGSPDWSLTGKLATGVAQVSQVALGGTATLPSPDRSL